jgi:hypothetical protein
MQTLENGVQVFTNGDPYNLAEDTANAFKSANITVNVANQAARDALTKYDGLAVRRKDVSGRPTETWDGSAWTRSPVITSAPYTSDGLWSISGAYLKTVVPGLAQVTATLQLVRTGPSMLINVDDTTLTSAIVPSGFRPSANAFFAATVNDNFGSYKSSPQLIINTGGALIGRSTSGGAVSLGTGYTLFISVNWYI